jgi:arsenical pump membrane protein
MPILAVLLVAAVMTFAVVRPRDLPEITAAAPAVVVALVTGLVTWSQARTAITQMASTVGFLAAILVLAHLADAMGVFTWIAGRLRRGSRGSPTRLLSLVFVAASATTAILSLDATVVLLTPVVIASARTMGMDPRPHSYASAHLSNTASTLLPVSNLTNLLAFNATGLTFVHFTALMVLPWLASIVVELFVFRRFFARSLGGAADSEPRVDTHSEDEPMPTAALVILALTLVGFALSGFVDIAPAWIATAGAAMLAGIALRRRRTTLRRTLAAADLLFCAFVLALGIVVAGVADGPIGQVISHHLPTTTKLLDLLVMAAAAAVLSNLVNNLPATLLLLAAVGPHAPPALILALLLGVNLGPNLTYVGSLAIMLWRRVSAQAQVPAQLRTFTTLGAMTVPVTLLVSVVALWCTGRWL